MTTSGFAPAFSICRPQRHRAEPLWWPAACSGSRAPEHLVGVHPGGTKDKQDRYLTSADPTRDEASSVWGVSVLVTTQIDPSVGVLLDTTKFGRVLMREPLSIRTGLNEDDFTRNIMRFICEERISLEIERPAAVSIITGLPTS